MREKNFGKISVSIINDVIYIYEVDKGYTSSFNGNLSLEQWKEIDNWIRNKHFIAVRCGDNDGYNHFCDLHGAIEYLQENQVSQSIERMNAYNFCSDEFKGNNHISIFWAKDDNVSNPSMPLSSEEFEIIRIQLK